MFGNQSLPSCIWSYDAYPPIAGADLVDEQLYLTHRYRNDLVRCELDRRAAVEAVLAPHLAAITAEVERLTAAVEAAAKDIKAQNQRARRRVASAVDRALLADLKQQRKVAYAHLKAKKAELFERPAALRKIETQISDLKKRTKKKGRNLQALPEYAALATALATAQEAWFAVNPVARALAEIDVRDQERRRQLRKDCGLYWGTYLAVEQSCQNIRRGAPPKIRRFYRGEGKLAVQIQASKPLTTAALWSGSDGRLGVRAQPFLRPHPTAPQKDDRTGCEMIAALRIGGQGQQPVFAEIPFVLHRPLPEAHIKWIYLIRRLVGTSFRDQLQFVLSRPDGFAPGDRSQVGAVGIDVGWRLLDVGLRVAYWTGSDGRTGQLLLPKEQLSRWQLVDDLRSIRATMFDAKPTQKGSPPGGIRAVFRSWLAGEAPPPWLEERLAWLDTRIADKQHPRPHRRQELHRLAGLAALQSERAAYQKLRQQWQRPEQLPEWLTERTETLGQWRAQACLAALVLHWREHRFSGDDAIFAALEAWRKRDKHLFQYEAHLRRKVLVWREHHYREFAAGLRRDYATAYIEDTDWSKLNKKPAIAEDRQSRGERQYMPTAAVGELLRFIREAMTETVAIDPVHSTHECWHCGSLEEFDAATDLCHRCRHCHRTWDQDENASRVLLQRGLAELP